MIKRIAVGVVISLLLLGGTSMALADTNAGGGETGLHFTYTLLANGNFSDITFGNMLLANNANATGYPALVNGAINTTKTMTIFSGQDSNDLWMLTSHQSMLSQTSKDNVTMALALAEKPEFLGNKPINPESVQIPMNIRASNGWNIYSLSAGNYSAYLLTNGKVSSESGSNLTFYSNESAMFIPLMAGLIIRGNVQAMIQEHSYENHENNFTYNQSTGNVTGKFVTFNINKASGQISNFTANETGQQVFSGVRSEGNGNITANADLPVIRTPVMTVGGLFVYSKGSAMYAIHNNPSLESKFLVYNGTINLTLSGNLTASEFSTPGRGISCNTSELSSNLSYIANVSFGYNHRIESGPISVLINNSNFYGFLLINNGNLQITGKTLIVTSPLNQIASVSFVAPVGLQRMDYEYQHMLSYAFTHGKLASYVSVGMSNSVHSNITMALNTSVDLSVTSLTYGKLALQLSSTEHTGTAVGLFISNQVINSTGKIYVYLDGTAITLSSYNNVINSTSDTNAFYAVIPESAGMLLIVHVPHFSNHTLVVSSSPLSNSGSGLPSLGIYDYAVIGVVAAAIASIMVVRRKKN